MTTDPKLARVQLKINEVTDQMHTNVQKAMERGDQLDYLDAQAQDLNERAGMFAKNAKSLRRVMLWRSWRWRIFIIFIIVIVLIGILWWAGAFDKS